MNVGYFNTKDLDNPINYEVCPICGKNIYISKHQDDYACVDINCPLGNGAKFLVDKIILLQNMLTNK